MKTLEFFESQKQADIQSAFWRIFFLATAIIASFVIGQTGEGVFSALMNTAEAEPPSWSSDLSFKISTIVFGILFTSVLFHTLSTKKHGFHSTLTSSGARKIHFGTVDKNEKKLINVTQEMALASGAKLPALYILTNDESINAFTVGFNQQSAAIVITEAALEHLTRAELQGVIAHEFAHILNSDVALNTKFIPFAKAFQFTSTAGWIVALITPLLMLPLIASILILDLSAGSVLIFAATTIAAGATGPLGKISLLLLQVLHSRTREWKADAAAVQFTRDPSGLRGALEKVDRNRMKEILGYKRLKQFEHMFFVQGFSSILGKILSTHPPLISRIRALGNTNYISTTEKIYFRVAHKQESILESRETSLATAQIDIANHLANDASNQRKVSMIQALSNKNRPTHDSLARAKRILYLAHSQFGDSLETHDGIYAVVFALALRLSSGKIDDLISNQGLLNQRQYGLVKNSFFPFFLEFPFADCLSFIQLACLHTKQWSNYQRHLLLNKVIVLYKCDYEISAKEMSFILVLGRELLDDVEMSKFGSSQATSDRYPDLANFIAFICHTGHSDNEALMNGAYNTGMSAIGLTDQRLPRLNDITPEGNIRAVGRICSSRGKTRKAYLKAFVEAILADEAVHENEFHILRAICYTLNIPIPLPPPN